MKGEDRLSMIQTTQALIRDYRRMAQMPGSDPKWRRFATDLDTMLRLLLSASPQR